MREATVQPVMVAAQSYSIVTWALIFASATLVSVVAAVALFVPIGPQMTAVLLLMLAGAQASMVALILFERSQSQPPGSP